MWMRQKEVCKSIKKPEVPMYHQMLTSGLSDAMLSKILPKFDGCLRAPCAPPGVPGVHAQTHSCVCTLEQERAWPILFMLSSMSP